MNFLAHIYLSGNSEKVLIGNFIGDAIKGSAYNKYPNEIRKGILLHRRIDYFTDKHEIVRQSKNRIRNLYGKHAGIVIDIFYDHFLAINWKHYSKTPLKQFIKKAYEVLMNSTDVLPDEVMRYLPYMVLNDWLGSYVHIESIEMILNGMSRRTSLPNQTKSAIEILKEQYDHFNKEFKQFFEEIQNYCVMEIKNLTF